MGILALPCVYLLVISFNVRVHNMSITYIILGRKVSDIGGLVGQAGIVAYTPRDLKKA